MRVELPDDVRALAAHLLDLNVDRNLVAKAAERLTEHGDAIGEWIELAVALREREQYDAALAVYDAAMRRFPDSHVLWSNRGFVFMDWELYDEALRHFERALEIEPGYVVALRNIGHVHERRHDFERAVPLYRRVLEREPGDASTWNSLALCTRQLGDEDAAIGFYRRSLESDPTFTDPLFNLATLLVRRGEHEEAERLASRVVELAPYDGRAERLLDEIRERRPAREIETRAPYEKRTDSTRPPSARPRDRLYTGAGDRIPDDAIMREAGAIGLRAALLDDAIWQRNCSGEHLVTYPLRVFLSYKWGTATENAWVARLAEKLRARGWGVVFDRDRDETIDRSVEELVSRILACRVFIAIATPAYVHHGINPKDATWVFDECQIAMSSELGMYRIALTPDGTLSHPELRPQVPLVRLSTTGDRSIPALFLQDVQEPRFEEVHAIPADNELDAWLDQHLTYDGPTVRADERTAIVERLERARAQSKEGAALDLARDLAAECPFMFDVWPPLVEGLTAAGRLDEALTALAEAIEHVHPWDARILLERERIDLLNQAGRPLEAIHEALRVLERRSFDWVSHFYVGNHLDDCNELWGARNHLLLACEDRFASAEAFNTLGVVYLGLGLHLRARQAFEGALQRDANHERAAANLSRVGAAESPQEHANALRAGPGPGCTTCIAMYVLTDSLPVLCAACGGRRPAFGRCPYCDHDGMTIWSDKLAELTLIRCPTCRVGSLVVKPSFEL